MGFEKPTEENIRNELIHARQTFDFTSGLGPQLLEQCVAIGVLLGGGPAAVEAALSTLELALQGKAKKAGGVEGAKSHFGGWQARMAGTAPKDANYARLLSSILSETEQGPRGGFKVLADGAVKIYTGFLSDKAFAAQAEDPSQWKDLVASDHGEYTHRLQWYIVMKSALPTVASFGDVFLEINKRPGLWDYLFDRSAGQAPRRYNDDDFRGPEALNAYLCKNAAAQASFPLLSSFLQHRWAKRDLQFGDKEKQEKNMKGYISRKLKGGRRYDELNEHDRKDVDDAYVLGVIRHGGSA